MKPLTSDQFKKVGVYNLHHFAYKYWFVHFTPYSRETVGSAGWAIDSNKLPENTRYFGSRRVHISFCGQLRGQLKGNVKPDELLANFDLFNKVLDTIGVPRPKRLVRVMGGWVDGDFYDKRMAQLRQALEDLKA
jgi:hypothetical protein